MSISSRAVRTNPLHVLVALARRKGDCFVYASGPSRSFLVNRPEYARHVLVDRAADYSKDTPINAGFATTIADALLTSEGETWRHQRTLLQPAFARRNVPALAEVVSALVDQMTTRWEGVRASDGDIDLSGEMSQLLFRVTAAALFHVDTSPWDGPTTQLLTDALPVLTDLNEPAFVVAQQDIWNLADRVVAERLKSDAVIDDALGALMASGGDDAEPGTLRDHVVTLALAGYETTASVATWACYVLAKRPEIAAELREHIASVVGDRPIAIDDLPSLPLLTAVVKEILRLYPPAWIIGRRALRPDRIGDTEIPTNSVVAISPYVLHRHPAYWADPETFDPRRFMNASAEGKRHPFSYIPFGAGPRTCIGVNFALVEAPLIIGLLMQRFQMTLANGAEVQPQGIFVLVPQEPIRVRLAAA